MVQKSKFQESGLIKLSNRWEWTILAYLKGAIKNEITPKPFHSAVAPKLMGCTDAN